MSNNIWTVILGPIVMFTALYAVDQYTVQRLYTLPNLKKIQKCFNYTLVGFIVLQFLMLYLGMVIYANYYDCDPLKVGKVARNDEIVTLLDSS
ncbi:uncharacterized protein B4U80_03349 [Leptotrombidium deliense]|uniref:Uncharacterized protein n=1 Tax=Leptotrombidium deliense TaxID=299467 RepID=A0A443QT85_9ACAR|nr:uncharacterized protein B4U80_03349 [Leptotrombidium deliense]